LKEPVDPWEEDNRFRWDRAAIGERQIAYSYCMFIGYSFKQILLIDLGFLEAKMAPVSELFFWILLDTQLLSLDWGLKLVWIFWGFFVLEKYLFTPVAFSVWFGVDMAPITKSTLKDSLVSCDADTDF